MDQERRTSPIPAQGWAPQSDMPMTTPATATMTPTVAAVAAARCGATAEHSSAKALTQSIHRAVKR